MLTVAPVEAFGFLGNAPGTIEVDGSRLRVPRGATLSLIGGDLSFTNSTLYAPDGRLNMASAGSAGEIIPTANGLELRGFDTLGTINIAHTEAQRPTVNLGPAWGRVELGNFDVSGAGGGNIFIQGERLLNQNGWLFADIYGDRSGSKIDVALNGAMRFTLDARLTSTTLAAGRGGDITLNVGTLSLNDRAFITTAAWFDNQQGGDGGNLSVNARDAVTITGINDDGGRAGLSADALKGSTGDAGTIQVTTPVLTLNQQGVIQSSTQGSGAGGHVKLNVGILTLDNRAYISTDSLKGATGDAGAIYVNTPVLTLSQGSAIQSDTLGSGAGGSVTLDVGFLTIESDAVIETGSWSKQAGGNVGDIILNVDDLKMTGGGRIITETWGAGQGGNLIIHAHNAVIITGVEGNYTSGLYAGALGKNPNGNNGNAGYIEVTTSKLTLDDGGLVIGEAERASGGVITLQVDHLKLLNGSEISSSVSGDDFSDGGNVTLNGANVVALDGSSITATARQGKGGNITVNAGVFLHNAADVQDVLNASSQRIGNDGTVQNNAPQVDISGSLTVLPSRYSDAAARLGRRCGPIDSDERNNFIVQGHGALARSPDESLQAPLERCIPLASVAPTPAPQSEATVVPNTGFGNR
ncbi:MAG: hypothetical protein KDJ28_18010 [Candidatus Competibacteraceae bacterium]|nr:hypothetical protein [Candidatus Competibacteraceae bacterium]